MKTVNVHQAKTHLSRLLEEVMAGEEVVIARAGKPVARLVAFATSAAPRQLGQLAGKVVEHEDAWAPDDDIEVAFYGGDVEPAPVLRVAEPRPKAAKAGPRKKK